MAPKRATAGRPGREPAPPTQPGGIASFGPSEVAVRSVAGARSLRELLAVLLLHQEAMPKNAWGNLPSFGGDEPRSMAGILTWDAYGYLRTDLTIVCRVCWSEGCQRVVREGRPCIGQE